MSADNTKYILNEALLALGSIYSLKPGILSTNYWHKIIVKNVHGQSRDDVLRSLMEAAYPRDLIPVNYECSADGGASFLLKNCGQAILVFCHKKLTVPHFDKEKQHIKFKINVVLNEVKCKDLKVDLQPAIVKVLKRRYVEEKKYLDLEEFHLDRDLIHFTPLNQPRLLNYIFHLSNEFEIEHLNLKNNQLTNLKSFEVLLKGKSSKTLTTVDFRKNKLQSIDDLYSLKPFPINELFLEENPLCNDLKEHEYISNAKKNFPNLGSLDGVRISPNGMVPLRRNYLCDYSAQDFVDKFMEHYFSLYDHVKDRVLLKDLYHENAIFTLTSRILSGQPSSLKSKLLDFQKFSHNIKSIVNYARIHEMVFIGPENIVKLFTSFPLSEHDPSTFTVDLTYAKDNVTIITITGVFKNESESVLEVAQLYNFMRTFVLMKIPNEEYRIINEVLNVTNASSLTEKRAFKSEIVREKCIHVPIPQSNQERDELIGALMLLTNLKTEWARKCLLECKFDLKRSLVLFVDLLKGDKLPAEAFSNFTAAKSPLINLQKIQVLENTETDPRTHDHQSMSENMNDIEEVEVGDSEVEEKIVQPFSDLLKIGFTTSLVDPRVPNLIRIHRPPNKSLKKGLRFFGPSGQTVVIKPGRRESSPQRVFYKGEKSQYEKNPIEAQSQNLASVDKNLQKNPTTVQSQNSTIAEQTKIIPTQSTNIEVQQNVVVCKEVQSQDRSDEKMEHNASSTSVEVSEIKKEFTIEEPSLDVNNNYLFDSEEYVKDLLKNCPPQIKNALGRAIGTSIKTVQNTLSAAIGHLEERQGHNLWHYKLLANECYLHGCYQLGRELQDIARRNLTTDEREIFSEICLLLEIQYTPTEQLDILMLKKMKNVWTVEIINMIAREGYRIPFGCLSDLLIRMANFELQKDKLNLIYTVLHDVQYTHGFRPLPKIREILTKHAGFKENSEIKGPIYKEVAEPEKIPPMNVTASVYSTFRQFRQSVLFRVGVYIDEFKDHYIREFVKFRGTKSDLVFKGNALIQKHFKRFAIVKIVVAKFWEYEMFDEIKCVFDRKREQANPETLALVYNLRLVYNIKYDIQYGSTSDIKQEIRQFINASELQDLLNFLEDLANERDKRISLVFESFIQDPMIDRKKQMFIAYAYKVYALKLKDEEIILRAESYCSQFNGGFEAFHYEETLQTLVKMPIPFDVTGKHYSTDFIKALMERYLTQYKYSFMVGLHVIWIYHLKKLAGKAHSVRSRCLKILRRESEDLYFKFSIISAILEATHGNYKEALFSLEPLRKKYSDNMNYICTLAECHLQNNDFAKAREILLPIFQDVNYIMDPEVQKTIFMYSINWDIKMNTPVIFKLLNPATKRKLNTVPLL